MAKRLVLKMFKIVDTTDEERRHYSLNDDEIQELAKQAMIIEKHYGRPMDIEWAKDGVTGELLIVQARPETVRSRDDQQVMERFQLNNQASSKTLIEGRAIGQRIGAVWFDL